MVSMDFFTVSTLTGRTLFVLVLLSHDRGTVSTPRPTASLLSLRLNRRSYFAGGFVSVNTNCSPSRLMFPGLLIR